MKIVVPRENEKNEKRTPLTPLVVKKLEGLGAEVIVEGDLLLTSLADLVIRLNKPRLEEINCLKNGAIHLSLLDPFNSPHLIQAFCEKGISALCLELIPRSTRAQKMDVLSSQASLAGYAAVILATDHLPKIFPMMTTPSGTIPPAKVFVIGAGVAGLQAIATAKRLGATVEAFDTRPAALEQIRSLGARCLKINLASLRSGEMSEVNGGYAGALTDEQLRKQREGIKKACQIADVVITTAQVFGKKAPLIVTRDILEGMKPGSLVIDLAVESGGNVEGVELNREVSIGTTRVFGYANMAGRVAHDASMMLANNIFNFIEEFWDKNSKSFNLNLEDEIIKGCLLTYAGKIVHPLFFGGG